MAEVIRNDGPWKQWLACCPSMPDHLFDVGLPLNASPSSISIFGVPAEIAAKIGSNPDATAPLIPVTGVAQQLLAIDINKKWESVQELLATNRSIWQGKTEELHALFLECCAQVSSRNFHRESQERPGPFLLPTIDFLNHSQERSNVSFIIHGGGGGKKHVSFDVMAKRDIQPKEQLFHDYGSLSASRFLVEFQFVSHEKALKQDITLQFSLQAAATTFAILACTSPATSIFANGKVHDTKNWSLESNVKTAQASGVNDNFMYFLNRSLFRVNKLVQSDMIFYEEGLMLVDEETMALARVGDSAKEERRETMKSTRFRTEALRVALFLLAVDDASFDVLYSKVITRYWQVGDLFKSSRELKKTAAGVNFMTNVLGIPADPDCVDSVVPSASETSKVASLASMNGKPIRTDDTLLNVMDTHILLPFLKVRQSITEFQAETIEKAAKPGPFRTERTGNMVAQVLRHEARIIQAEIDAAIKLAETRNDIV
eukprot:TRINITY_DN8784_c0_g2_i8.p1 TRINITY_DN8784_c0_g2~~TRINITY_DN8784_c0_g2_i8.p1  ORF type:complete len:487 (-),score=101.90 TRINITY_DN8784_c0_g2_i8:203-1663(-)